jgi:putative nucleotidyltransferase with HDIG domain
VGLAAAAMFAANVKGLSTGHPDGWLVGVLALAGVLALEFPLHASINEKLSVASAVFFAAVLLLPMWQAAVLVGGLQGADLCIAALRRTLRTHETPPLRAVGINVVFNGGQAYLSALAAGWLLAAGGVSAGNGLAGPQDVAVVAAAAVLMYCLNLVLVAVAKALMTSRNPLHLFFDTQRIAYVQFASLYVLGAVTAFATVRVIWIPVLAVVPAFLVYHSLRQRVEMRRDAMRAMERMAEEVDRRDPYTYNHSQRVAVYTHAIARRLGMGAADVDMLVLAAKVHDIGKIRIPDSILLKPARLTDAERRVMETHPRLGFDILKPFSEYAKVLDLVLTHHERYDGKGYPNGVVGRRLMLIAQVIPVADSLDAMTSARAYRGARSWVAAMGELRRGAGTQWNPQVVEAAIAVLAPQQRAEPALVPARAASA